MNTTLSGNDYGIGFREVYSQELLAHQHSCQWFEILSDNYLFPGGNALADLYTLRDHYPLAMHSVSLSLGSVSPLDEEYLSALRKLADDIAPVIVSDHLCWNSVHGIHLHDLLPLPYTTETLTHLIPRIHHVQERLNRRLTIENVSSYITFEESEYDEANFLNAIATQTGAALLLDINNVAVSAFNHQFCPREFILTIEPAHVSQFHLAGHRDEGTYRLDTHDQPISREVFELYALAKQRFPDVPTLIERDDAFPPLSELLTEMETTRSIGMTHAVS